MNPIEFADLRALLAAFLLYYLTGLPLARCLARGAGGPAAAWALPSSLAILMGALFLARLAGFGLSAATWVVAFLVLLSMLGSAWLERRQRSARPPEVGGPTPGSQTPPGEARPPMSLAPSARCRVRPFEWWLIGILAAVLLSIGGPLGMVYDAFDHLAAIRRTLLSKAIIPLDIFYRGGDGAGWDPRKGFLHPVHAFTCQLAQVDPLNLWRILPALLCPGVVLAVSRFMRAWTGWGRRGDLALLAWVLFGSGSGFLWLVRIGYPNHVAYPLSFFALGLAIEYVLDGRCAGNRQDSSTTSSGQRGRGRLAGITVLAFCGALIHLVAPILLVSGLGLLAAAVLFSRSEPRAREGRSFTGAGLGKLRPVGATFLAAAAGMFPPVLFRLLTQGRADSTLHTHMQGLFFLGGDWLIASPLMALAEIGPAGVLALVVLPLAVRSVAAERRSALAWFTAAPWIAVATPLFTPLYRLLGYLVTRFLGLVPVGAVLVLALEESWRRVRRRPGRTRDRIAPALLGMAVVVTAGWAVSRLPASYRHEARQAHGVDVPLASAGGFQLIRAGVQAAPGRPPVVLADPFTSYAIGGLTGAHLVSTLNQHGPPVDRRWRQRLDDQNEMLFGYAGAAQLDSLLGVYQVDLVYVNQAFRMPVSDFGSLLERRSVERARRRIEADPERFQVIYRGPDGLVASVRVGERRVSIGADSNGPAEDQAAALPPASPLLPPAAPPTAALPSPQSPSAALPAEPMAECDSLRVSPGPFPLGFVSLLNVALPVCPLHWREVIGIPISWVRTAPAESDLPVVVQLRMRTSVPPHWYSRPAWSKLARYVTQRRDHYVYRFRLERPPFDGQRSLARLPLNQPVPDTLRIRIPPAAAPGEYEVTVAVTEKTFVPNFEVRDLLRDVDGFEGPVVGRVTILK